MWLFLTLAAAVVASCGDARRGPPTHPPLRLDTAAEQRGQVVFFMFCHQCHPQGEAGLGPAINNKPVPSAAIRLQVRQGLGAMPSFSDNEISERELDDLLAYLDALREQDEVKKKEVRSARR
jgi:mono/diheme cytochrome c family protein